MFKQVDNRWIQHIDQSRQLKNVFQITKELSKHLDELLQEDINLLEKVKKNLEN